MTLLTQILLLSSLISGSPMKATVNDGVAPLRFELANGSRMMGVAYISNPEVCDIFVAPSSRITTDKSLYYCAFEEFSADGTPIYSEPQKVVQTPWEDKYGSVKITNVGDEVGAFVVTTGKIHYAEYNSTKRSFSKEYTKSISYDKGTEYPIEAWDVVVNQKDHTAEVVLLCRSREEIVPKFEDKSHAIYNSGGLYMGQLSAGTLFRGELDLDSWKIVEPFVQVGEENIMTMPSSVASVRSADGKMDGYVVGNKVGAMKYVPRKSPEKVTYLASEGSLKLKEITYTHSEAYAAGELKHGTISLIEEGTPVVSLANDPRMYEKMLSNIREVKARGAMIIAVCAKDADDIIRVADHWLEVPAIRPDIAGIAAATSLQLLAYYLAANRGLDVDKPRNLAKSVTVE